MEIWVRISVPMAEKCHVVNPTFTESMGIWNRRKIKKPEVALLQIFGRLTPNQRTCSTLETTQETKWIIVQSSLPVMFPNLMTFPH